MRGTFLILLPLGAAGEFKPDVVQFVDPIWLCAQYVL